MAFLNEKGVEHLWLHILAKLNTKVDKVEGKNLSTNDYTEADKNKLDGIIADATKTTFTAGDLDKGNIGTLKINDTSYNLLNAGFSNVNSIIPNHSDLNDYLDLGLHKVLSGANAATLTNTPFTELGFLLLTLAGYSTDNRYKTQLAFSNGSIAYRNTQGDNPGVWEKVLSVSSEVGASNSPVYVNSSGAVAPITSLTLASGNISIGDKTNTTYRAFSANRLVNNIGYSSTYGVSNDPAATFYLYKNDEIKNSFKITETGFLFNNGPLAIENGGTGATDSAGALTNLGLANLDANLIVTTRGTLLSTAGITDLNTITTPSIYYSDSSATSGSITNSPWTNSGYKLITFSGYSGTSSYGHQLAFARNQIFWRSLGDQNAAQDDWKILPDFRYSSNSLLTLKDVQINTTSTTDTSFKSFGVHRLSSDGNVYSIKLGVQKDSAAVMYSLTGTGTIVNSFTVYPDGKTFKFNGGPLPVGSGGTGSITPSGALVNLGAISSADQFIYNSGNIVASTTAPTAPTEGMIWIVVD